MSKEKKYYLAVSIIMCVIGALTISVAVFGFLNLSQRQAAVAEKEYYTEKMAEKQQILTALEKRYNNIEADIPLIDNALPSEKESSNLLSDLSAQASGSGLKLTFLRPDSSGGSSKTTQTKAVGDLSLLQTVKGTISYELPLIIKVTGSYNNFLTFIGKIENYQRLINIVSVDVEKKESETVGDYIEATLNIKAYLKK